MGLGSFHAQIENNRDFLAALAFGEQLGDFALAGSEAILGRLLGFPFTVEKSLQNHLGNTGGEEGGTALQSLNGGDEVARRVGFQPVSAATNCEATAREPSR